MSMSVAACFDDDDGDHFKMRIVNHISWLMLGTSESKIMGTKVENKNIYSKKSLENNFDFVIAN